MGIGRDCHGCGDPNRSPPVVLSADIDDFGPAPPWPAEELLDAALVRRLRSRVARQLADTQRERERRGQARLPEADEHALGAKLINDALEAHAHEQITRGAPPAGRPR